MANKQVKQYAVTVRVSPKPKTIGANHVKYKPATYKGVVLAFQRNEIEQLVKDLFIEHLNENKFDGTIPTRPIITPDEIEIVKVELYSDFFFRK